MTSSPGKGKGTASKAAPIKKKKSPAAQGQPPAKRKKPLAKLAAKQVTASKLRVKGGSSKVKKPSRGTSQKEARGLAPGALRGPKRTVKNTASGGKPLSVAQVTKKVLTKSTSVAGKNTLGKNKVAEAPSPKGAPSALEKKGAPAPKPPTPAPTAKKLPTKAVQPTPSLVQKSPGAKPKVAASHAPSPGGLKPTTKIPPPVRPPRESEGLSMGRLGRLASSTLPLNPPPVEPEPRALEERVKDANERLQKRSEEFQQQYREWFDMTWILHDAGLEGVSYSQEELQLALRGLGNTTLESNQLQVIEDIKRHHQAIELCRKLAAKDAPPLTVDSLKLIYVTLHPEEPDLTKVPFRKETPQHRLYFHEYAPPEKIPARLKQTMDWLESPETHQAKSTIRTAARAHMEILRTFPFAEDSGKVARLLMDIVLLRDGYLPAIIPKTERQRYYEALKTSPGTVISIVQESVENAVSSIEKLLLDAERRSAR